MAKTQPVTHTRTLTSTLADQMLESLQSAIVEGELQPGDKLREPDLAKRYGTSRGPLREALRRLEARKLVTTAPNTGARVVSLSNEQLLELYDMREALEGMTCRLAATNISDDEITGLDELLNQHEAELTRQAGRDYFRQEGDLDFHFRIAKACGNTLLANVLCIDHYHLMRLYRYKFSTTPGRPARALYEHRRIFEALRERDGELAELLMRKHIRAARENVARQFSDTNDAT
ncbi:MAG: GntR family transcriptional regulator [Woeseiaceae bacterium]